MPSPFGAPFVNNLAATASPVKKKMSLSDYKSRMSKVQAARPSVSTASLKTPLPNADELKSASSLDTPGALDSPSTDKKNEAQGLTNGAPAASTLLNGTL